MTLYNIKGIIDPRFIWWGMIFQEAIPNNQKNIWSFGQILEIEQGQEIFSALTTYTHMEARTKMHT